MKKYAIIMIVAVQKCLIGLIKCQDIPGGKSLKAPFAIYLDLECILKKLQSSKKTLKNLIQRKNLDMSLLVGQCLQDFHLIKKKINLIIIEEKIEKLCKYLKDNAMEIIEYEKKRNYTIDS